MSASKLLDNLSPEMLRAFLEKEDRLCQVRHGIESPYFSIQPGVIIGPSGEALYDRPLIREKPSISVVTWGRDANGIVLLGLIFQQRPPADDPRYPGNGHEPVTFAQVAMGYLEKLSEGECLKENALRELVEEMGECRVLNVENSLFPKLNIEPNTYASWHNVVFVEVDLSTIDREHSVPAELILKVVFKPATEILQNIAAGWDTEGVCYRGGGTTLAPLMIFFATHPDLFPRPTP